MVDGSFINCWNDSLKKALLIVSHSQLLSFEVVFFWKCFWTFKCKFHMTNSHEISTLLNSKLISFCYANYFDGLMCHIEGEHQFYFNFNNSVWVWTYFLYLHLNVLMKLTGIHQYRLFGCLLRIVHTRRCDHQQLQHQFAFHHECRKWHNDVFYPFWFLRRWFCIHLKRLLLKPISKELQNNENFNLKIYKICLND